MSNYLIVPPEGGLTSEERAAAISRQLYCITRPESIQNPDEASFNLFGSVINPTTGEAALSIQLDWLIYVNAAVDLTELQDLFPLMPQAEKDSLTTTITTSPTVVFNTIIPTECTVRDQAYMEANGWFPPEPEVETEDQNAEIVE
tara:strand:- start:24954 stop:25388 length:435 start_codon:yes stop_codon:yes gene_type:complete